MMKPIYFYLNTEDTLTDYENDDLFYICKTFIDYSFDDRGVLQIQTYMVDSGVTIFHSFCTSRLYEFVRTNKSYTTSIGKITLYNSIIEGFKDFDINNWEQINLLIEISESLDNNFMTNKIKKEEFLKQISV